MTTTATPWYFADGTEKLIRVKTSAPMGSPAFFDAPAQRYTARVGWIESRSGHNLASEAINSGDYAPVDEAEAMRVMHAIRGANPALGLGVSQSTDTSRHDARR
jgi:hypothetical protein